MKKFLRLNIILLFLFLLTIGSFGIWRVFSLSKIKIFIKKIIDPNHQRPLAATERDRILHHIGKWNLDQCPQSSPGAKKKISVERHNKFIERTDGPEDSAWVRNVMKIKDFDIKDFFDQKGSFYYFFGDFNNDFVDDVLVFQKKHIREGYQRVSILLNKNNVLEEDKNFREMKLQCRHEQVLIADFDNDNDLDVFLTCYSMKNIKLDDDRQGRSYYLVNDGKGLFSEQAEQAGIAMENIREDRRVEGASVADFNNDGWLDFIAGSHFFINNKNGTFSNQRKKYGLPMLFDEGLNVADINNDGQFDVIYFRPDNGPIVYYRMNDKFFENRCTVQAKKDLYTGMNVFDINADGWLDIMEAWRPVEKGRSYVLYGSPKGLNARRVKWWEFNYDPFLSREEMIASAIEAPSFFRINDDYLIDLVVNTDSGGQRIFINKTKIRSSAFEIELVDKNGLRNQQGRKITLYSPKDPSKLMARLVDAGSGYLTQSQYPVLFYSLQKGPHLGKAYFSNNVVDFIVKPGQKLRIYEDGRIVELAWF